MGSILVNQIYANIVSTLIVIVVLLLVYALVYFISVREMESQRQRRRFRIRSFYITSMILLFLMARIWVEGFTHLLAILGLVSAALVVTNKETIMNFVGWLIINWRGLFSEDDLIQIQQYKGYVKAIGPLYFTLTEVSSSIIGDVTGRVIRIPNGLVTNNAIINMSQTSHLLEQYITIIFSPTSPVDKTIDLVQKTIDKILHERYKDKKEYSVVYLRKRNKQLADHISLATKISIHPKHDKPSGTELKIRFYCFSLDAEEIQQQIWSSLLNDINSDEEIDLVYAN